MYADSTPVVASVPSATHRTWPPAPVPRAAILIEPDPDGDTAPVEVRPAYRRRKPLVTRTYITAAGIVRETVGAPAPAKVAPLSPDRADAPKMRRFAEELDEVDA